MSKNFISSATLVWAPFSVFFPLLHNLWVFFYLRLRFESQHCTLCVLELIFFWNLLCGVFSLTHEFSVMENYKAHDSYLLLLIMRVSIWWDFKELIVLHTLWICILLASFLATLNSMCNANGSWNSCLISPTFVFVSSSLHVELVVHGTSVTDCFLRMKLVMEIRA